MAEPLAPDAAGKILAAHQVEGTTIHNSYGVCIWAAGPDIDLLGGPARFLGDQGHSLFHPEDQEIALRHHERLLAQGAGRIRQRIRDADGAFRWCVITSRIVQVEGQKLIVGHVRLDERLDEA